MIALENPTARSLLAGISGALLLLAVHFAHPAAAQDEPGRVVVDEDEAERALERSLVTTGALLLDPGWVEIAPSVTYVRDERDGVTVLPDGILATQQENVDEVVADVSARVGLPYDTQLELGLPFRWSRTETVDRIGFAPTDARDDSTSGIGDFRLGLAAGLLRERDWRPDLIARVTWDSATGRTRDDTRFLGSGFHEVRGSLVAVKRQDPLVFVASVDYEHAFEKDDVQPGSAVSPALTAFLAASPETSLRLGIRQTFQGKTEIDGQRIEGSDRNASTIEVGASSLLARGVLLDVTAGAGLTRDATDFVFTVALPIQFSLPFY